MSNSEKKLVSVPETSGKIAQRRNFLKWCIIGVLAAGPIGIVAWRRWKSNQCKYSFSLKEPFRNIESSSGNFPYVLQDGDASCWSGSTRGKVYTPKCVNLAVSGLNSSEPRVSVDVVFNVAEQVSKNHLALVRIVLWSGSNVSDSNVVAEENGQWNAPHKQPPMQGTKWTEDHTPNFTVYPPEEYLLVDIPLAELGKIDKITVDIHEIIRS
jgi:hypothetical protein